MKERLKKAASVAGLIALFFVLLALFVYYRYPWNNLKLRIIDDVSAHSPFVLKIGKLSPSVPVSVKVTDIRLISKQPPKVTITVDELVARPSVWSLMFGRLKLKLNARAYDGTLLVVVKDTGDGRFDLQVSADGLSLDKFSWPIRLGEQTSIRLGGTLGFSGSGIADPKMKQQNISGELRLNQLALLSSTIYGVDVPDTRFSPFTLKFEIKNTQLTIKPTSVSGDKLDARLQGTVNLNQRSLDRSFCNITLRVKFKGEWGDSLDSLLSWVKAKDSEGFYKISISGPLNNLKVK